MAAPAPFFQSIVDMIYIHLMNFNSLDLNLLVALDALLLEANVSRAAMRIGLSQPAASHALQRLREVLGDPLLVRVGTRMELTPRAQALRGPLAQALDQVRGLFIPDDFDAASSERRFRLMMPDLAVELLVPPLMEKIAPLAPKRPARHRAMARACDLHRGVRPHHRSRDLDRRRLQGISPSAPLYRSRRARGATRSPAWHQARPARCFPQRTARRGRDPR